MVSYIVFRLNGLTLEGEAYRLSVRLYEPSARYGRLSVRACRHVWGALSEKNMCMLDEIRAKRDEIYAIARRHKAEKPLQTL